MDSRFSLQTLNGTASAKFAIQKIDNENTGKKKLHC